MSAYYSPKLDIIVIKPYRKEKKLLRSVGKTDSDGNFFMCFSMFYYIGEF